MSDNTNWQVARLDEIERRGRDIPVRERIAVCSRLVLGGDEVDRRQGVEGETVLSHG